MINKWSGVGHHTRPIILDHSDGLIPGERDRDKHPLHPAFAPTGPGERRSPPRRAPRGKDHALLPHAARMSSSGISSSMLVPDGDGTVSTYGVIHSFRSSRQTRTDPRGGPSSVGETSRRRNGDVGMETSFVALDDR